MWLGGAGAGAGKHAEAQPVKIPGPSSSSQNRTEQRANFLALGAWCTEQSCQSAGPGVRPGRQRGD